MLLVWIYVALASYNTGYLTLGLESIETIIDDAADVATHERQAARSGKTRKGLERVWDRRDSSGVGMFGETKDWKAFWSTGTDAVMDVPLGGVCEVLYGEGREMEDEVDDL